MIGGIASVKWLESSIRIAKFLLIFLTSAYFFFMARETAPFDMTSRVPEIIDVLSDILVDFLVMLARVVDAVPPGSPMEGLSIVMLLVGEMASARTTIGSWRGGSANRARQVGRSLILVDLVDLAVRQFKHGSDLGDF